MPGFNPSQVSFAGGEISPRLHGRVDADLFKRSLALCQNFIPLPHGPALMRAGSRAVSAETVERIIPFNVSDGEPYALVLKAGELRIRDHLGAPVTFLTNLATNGRFDAGTSGWTLVGAFSFWRPGGYVEFSGDGLHQALAFAAGVTYTVRFRARVNAAYSVAGTEMRVNVDGDVIYHPTHAWADYSFTVTPATPRTEIKFWTTSNMVAVDDVFITNDATPATSFLVAPWTADQLEAVQYDQDLTKNRMMLVHGNVSPQLVGRYGNGLWEIIPAELTGAPASWGGTNSPSAIDWGFQGRQWLGGAPDEPNIFAGSKPGYPFDFTLGVTPADGVQFSASVRGAIRWMQGQKSLLIGAERAEQAAHGGGSVITPSNVQVEDESAFGSAAIQAAHLGDEVVFVDNNRRELRALSFDALTKNGWVAKPVSFLWEHLVRDIKEVHFARSPDPMILVVRRDGSLMACVYDKAEGISAGWRIDVGAGVVTAAVVEATVGSELWMAVDRPAGPTIEVLPLHEVAVAYLDAHVTGAVPVTGVIPGLAHLEGETVRVLVDGTLLADQVVAGGTVTVDVSLATKTYVVGLPYRAKAKQLPLEGGLATGSSQSAKRRRTKVRLRLNNSAIPLLNGKRAPERAPADPMDTSTDLVTGDVDYQVLGWEDDGALTIEQDLPFRTEILAVFGSAQANEV